MGRRSGLGSFVMAAAGASAKAARQSEAAYRRQHVFQERQAKAYAREYAKTQKEEAKRAKQEYLEMRLDEASDLTAEADDLFDYLQLGIIPETLEINDTINFETLKPKYEPPKLEIPKHLISKPIKPLEQNYIDAVGDQPFLGVFFSSIKKKWLNQIVEARLKFKEALARWESENIKQNEEIKNVNDENERRKKQYELDYVSKCGDVETFRNEYLANDVDAVTSYVSMVLERSEYKIEWEREFEVAYSIESKEILVEFKLPNFDIVPTVGEFKYVKTRDEIEGKQRKKSELESCYKMLIANIAIRTIHEIVESDEAKAISIIGFNGYVSAIDPSNGKLVKPTILSVARKS